MDWGVKKAEPAATNPDSSPAASYHHFFISLRLSFPCRFNGHWSTQHSPLPHALHSLQALSMFQHDLSRQGVK